MPFNTTSHQERSPKDIKINLTQQSLVDMEVPEILKKEAMKQYFWQINQKKEFLGNAFSERVSSNKSTLRFRFIKEDIKYPNLR